MPDGKLREKAYLGDGVYAGFDGFRIWLWTDNGIDKSKKIAVEPETYAALHRYAKGKVRNDD